MSTGARRRRHHAAKRALDLLLAVPLAALAIPAVVLLSAALAVQLRANPLFLQERVGQGGRSFRLPKLRTLPPTVPAYALKTDIDLRPATRLARLVRSTKLDELPQLSLVLTGRLSLVGPRPKMPDVYEPASTAYRAMREALPQGCTGLWQVSVAADDLPTSHPEYDAFYVEHASLRLDGWILWRTAALAAGRRRVTLDDVPPWVRRRPAAARTTTGAGQGAVPSLAPIAAGR
jgi:lipopolysaccharide/colanic/teichoic acid biosynthesis glycosyltransferase